MYDRSGRIEVLSAAERNVPTRQPSHTAAGANSSDTGGYRMLRPVMFPPQNMDMLGSVAQFSSCVRISNETSR